jgi:hypothetical protein
MWLKNIKIYGKAILQVLFGLVFCITLALSSNTYSSISYCAHHGFMPNHISTPLKHNSCCQEQSMSDSGCGSYECMTQNIFQLNINVSTNMTFFVPVQTLLSSSHDNIQLSLSYSDDLFHPPRLNPVLFG